MFWHISKIFFFLWQNILKNTLDLEAVTEENMI